MLFGSLFGRKSANLFLGSPEAEAEATAHSRVPLTEVYEDFHDLLHGLSGEKFIVVGRKGAGKSAFGEYVQAKSQSDPTLHCAFIRKSDCNLERAVQLGQESGAEVNSESFFRWIIYTNLIKLFLENLAAEQAKEYGLLKAFIDKNSGYIKVNELEIKQLISRHGFEVSVEQFRRFMSAKFNKNVETKSERAPYYKLLGHLEDLIVKLLKSSDVSENANSFVLFFDDLDIGFDATDRISVDSIVSLLRACRHVNNSLFGIRSVSAKAIILIRDDIEGFLAGREADTAKMFASYSSRINWYQEEYAGHPDKENSLNLKKFICRRIEYGFNELGLPISGDPWRTLVGDSFGDRSSFKQIVNQTLFRPRDLLLYFLPLDRGQFTYPLRRDDIRLLNDRYSEELAKEIKGELSSFYSGEVVETIFRALGCLTGGPSTYRRAKQVIDENCREISSVDILDYLYDRSLLGTVDERGWYTFKCRQSALAVAQLRPDMQAQIVVQYGIANYLRSRGYV